MYELAREQLEESVRVSDEIGFDYVSSDALLSLALIAEAEGNPSEAVRFTAEAAQRGEKADSPLAVARARLGEGLVLLEDGDDVDGAEEALSEARRQGNEMAIGYMVTEAEAALAEIALIRGDLGTAGEIVAGLSWTIDRVQLEGTLDPARVYPACIKVLDRVDPAAAAAVRSSPPTTWMGVSSSIGDDDDDLRQGFLGTRSNSALIRTIQETGGSEPGCPPEARLRSSGLGGVASSPRRSRHSPPVAGHRPPRPSPGGARNRSLLTTRPGWCQTAASVSGLCHPWSKRTT